MKAGFTTAEQIQLRDYIVELGVDCGSIEAVSFDEAMTNILKK